MLSEGDKNGVHRHPKAILYGFKTILEDYGLIELDLMGGKYTWEKRVRENLDRVFASASWWQKFSLCKLIVHYTIYSDHDHVQPELYSTQHPRRKFWFRFENMWLKEKSFHEEVTRYWRNLPPVHFLPKLLDLSKFMEKWGNKFFNKFWEKIRKQKKILSTYEGCET